MRLHMNVSLTPGLEKFISQKVESGLYNSASEVVRQALRLLVERDLEYQTKLETLRTASQEGLDSKEAIPWNPETFLNQVNRMKEKEKKEA